MSRLGYPKDFQGFVEALEAREQGSDVTGEGGRKVRRWAYRRQTFTNAGWRTAEVGMVSAGVGVLLSVLMVVLGKQSQNRRIVFPGDFLGGKQSDIQGVPMWSRMI